MHFCGEGLRQHTPFVVILGYEKWVSLYAYLTYGCRRGAGEPPPL